MKSNSIINNKPNIDPYLDYFTHIYSDNPKNIYHIKQFIDGVIFYQILNKIDDLHYSIDNEKINIVHEPIIFSQKLFNLKLVVNLIQCSNLYNQTKQQEIKQINLIKLLKYQDQEQFYKLSKLFVQVLFRSSYSEYFIQKMLITSQKTQQYFMKSLKNNISINNQNQDKDNIKRHENRTSFQKILQLQNQNQKLLDIIDQIIQEKQTLQRKQQLYQMQIHQKNKQIQKLTNKLNDFHIQSNQKQLCQLKSQLSEYYQQKLFIEQLKIKLLNYQKQQVFFIQQIDTRQIQNNKLKQKLQKFNQVQQQTKILKIQKQILMQENQRLNSKISKLQAQLQSKLNQLLSLNNLNKDLLIKLKQYEQKMSNLRQKLQNKDEQIYNLQLQLSIRHSTSLQLQDQHILTQSMHINKSINSQILLSLQHNNQNKKHQTSSILANRLKKQISLLNNRLKQSLQQNEVLKKYIQKLKINQIQNKKLVDIISHMNKYRGEENQILIKCLYKMRNKILKYQINQNQIQSQELTINKNLKIINNSKNKQKLYPYNKNKFMQDSKDKLQVNNPMTTNPLKQN